MRDLESGRGMRLASPGDGGAGSAACRRPVALRGAAVRRERLRGWLPRAGAVGLGEDQGAGKPGPRPNAACDSPSARSISRSPEKAVRPCSRRWLSSTTPCPGARHSRWVCRSMAWRRAGRCCWASGENRARSSCRNRSRQRRQAAAGGPGRSGRSIRRSRRPGPRRAPRSRRGGARPARRGRLGIDQQALAARVAGRAHASRSRRGGSGCCAHSVCRARAPRPRPSKPARPAWRPVSRMTVSPSGSASRCRHSEDIRQSAARSTSSRPPSLASLTSPCERSTAPARSRTAPSSSPTVNSWPLVPLMSKDGMVDLPRGAEWMGGDTLSTPGRSHGK